MLAETKHHNNKYDYLKSCKDFLVTLHVRRNNDLNFDFALLKSLKVYFSASTRKKNTAFIDSGKTIYLTAILEPLSYSNHISNQTLDIIIALIKC